MVFPSNITAVTALFTQLNHRRVAQLAMVVLVVYIAYISASAAFKG